MKRSATAIYTLLLFASVLLGLGLVAPCMSIHPSFGEYNSWVQLLRPDLTTPATFSILGGILQLMRGESFALGLLLMVFSVVFPSVKLATLWWGTAMLSQGRSPGVVLWIAHHAGKFSMLDVMVIALIVIAIKGLPGDTHIAVGWGLFAFAASVVLSMVASVLVKRLETPPSGVEPVSKAETV